VGIKNTPAAIPTRQAHNGILGRKMIGTRYVDPEDRGKAPENMATRTGMVGNTQRGRQKGFESHNNNMGRIERKQAHRQPKMQRQGQKETVSFFVPLRNEGLCMLVLPEQYWRIDLNQAIRRPR
jgi:hypothetical protein